MTSQDDLPRDDWLRAALREAPDAEAAPPATLRAAILREAAAKAKPAPSTAPPWRRAWQALGRPQWAAGFASVMVMVVAGVLWWDRPLDEALPPRAPRVTLPPPLAFNESASNELRQAEAPAATASPAAAPPRALAKVRPPAPRRPAAQAMPALAPPAPPVPTTSPPPSAAPAIASVATPPPAPPPPAAPAATPEPSRARALADAPPPAAKRYAETDTAAGFASSLSPGLFERRASAPAPAPALTPRPPPFSLQIDNLRSEIARTPGWTWQRDDAEPRPTNAAVDDWLGRLALALRGMRADSSFAVEAPTGMLRLQRDGRTRYTFRLDASGIAWLRQDGGVPSLEHFSLPAAEREALTDGLKRLAP